MTFDAVALCRDYPGPGVVIAAISAAGPLLRVDAEESARLILLYHDDGRLMLTIEGPRLIQVPGEAQRVLDLDSDDLEAAGLGAADLPHPVWWVESRAPTGDDEAASVARWFARALVTQVGGFSWTSR